MKASLAAKMGLRPKYTMVLYAPGEAAQTLKYCAELAAKRELHKPRGLKVYPITQVHEAFAMVKAGSGKAVVDMSGEALDLNLKCITSQIQVQIQSVATSPVCTSPNPK